MSEQSCYYCGAANTPSSQFCGSCGAALILQSRYRIVGVLGRGGFGVVFEADDTRLNRPCAIKQVYSSSHEQQQQIRNEVDILAQHASRLAFIPNIQDTWTDQGQTYIVMEYISGPTLDKTTRPWSPEQIEHFLRVMLENLVQLHAIPIIHRDIKPANIKYTPDGRCPYMLLDFGISKQGMEAVSVRALSPDYAPPEQAYSEPTDGRSDLYSLAATAYHLLTGQSPLSERMRQEGHLTPPRQLAPATPPALERALVQMLEKSPANRPPTAEAALALLDAAAPPALPTPLPEPPPPPAPSVAKQATRPVAAPVPSVHEQETRAATGLPSSPPVGRPPSRRLQPSVPAVGPTAPTSPYQGGYGPGRGGTPPGTRQAPSVPPAAESPLQSGVLRLIIGVILLLLVAGGVFALLANQASRPGVAVGDETPTAVLSPTPTPSPEPTDPAAQPKPTTEPSPVIEPTTPALQPNPTLPPPRPASRITFSTGRDGDQAIYTTATDGSEPRRLTGSTAGDYAPTWAPDGQQIAFHSNRDGNWEIYAINADGSGLRNLSNHPDNDQSPTWAPGGQALAFQSHRDGNWEIYTMAADGSNQRRLTENYASEFLPAWSPDGQRIAFTTNRDLNPDGRPNDEIYVMGTDGRNQINLTRSPASDKQPTWAPNSQQIAFTSDRDGNGEIYVMATDGTNLRNLTNHPGWDELPAWAPNGQLIAFVSNRDGNLEVYASNPDGSEPRNLTASPAGDVDPAVWTP